MAIYLIQLITIILLTLFLNKTKLLKSNKIKENILFVSTFFVLALPMVFRGVNVGGDLPQYYNSFKIIGESSWDFSNVRFEKGYCAFVKVLYTIFKNPRSLIITTALIINLSFLLFIKKYSKNIGLTSILYVVTNIFFFYTSAIRQGMALSLILLGLCVLNKNKKYTIPIYYLISFIAITFHTVALIGLFIPLLIFIKPNFKIVTALSIIGVICFIFCEQLFDILTGLVGKYSEYKNSQFDKSNYFGSLLLFLEMFIIFLTIAIECRKKEEYFNQWLLPSVGYLTSMALVMRMSMFNRISTMLSIFFIVWTTNMLEQCKYKKIYTFGIVFFLSISMIVIQVYRPNWYGVTPFSFY